MDLGTVMAKMNRREYPSADSFAFDVRLIFANCYKYNPPGHDVVAMAKKLEEVRYLSSQNSSVTNHSDDEIRWPEMNTNNDIIITMCVAEMIFLIRFSRVVTSLCLVRVSHTTPLRWLSPPARPRRPPHLQRGTCPLGLPGVRQHQLTTTGMDNMDICNQYYYSLYVLLTSRAMYFMSDLFQ